MTVTRWNPANDFMNLQREVNRIFNGISPQAKRDEEYESAVWSPRADVTENPDAYVLTFDLPGMSRDDVKLSFTENTLKVSGERKEEEDRSSATCHRVERVFGKFYRSFNFPTQVNAENIKANLENGVLSITVPKAEEVKPKEISIS